MVAYTFSPSIWAAQTFNPSTREVEPGREMAGQREEYEAGGDRSSDEVSARIGKLDRTALRLLPKEAKGKKTCRMWGFFFSAREVSSL